MKGIFLANIILLVLVNLIIKPIWVFGIDRNIQISIGNEHYGLYSALLSISIIINSVLDIGLTNYNNRQLAKDFTQHNKLYPSILSAKFLLSILYFILILLIGIFSGYSPQTLYMLILIGIIQFLNSFLAFLRSNISALHHFKFDTLLSVLDKILIILFWAYLLTTHSKHLISLSLFVYSQIGAYIISIGVAIYYLHSIRFSFRISFNLSSLKKVVREALPTAFLILLMSIYLRSDNYLIERLLGEEGKIQSGLHYSAFRILDAFNMIGILFASLLLPIFSRQLALGSDIKPIVTMAVNMLIPTSIAIAIFGYFQQSSIIQLLYHHHNHNLPKAFGILILCFPLLSILNIFCTLLTANNNIKTLIVISSLACFIGIVSNIVFTPHYGYVATCYISVVTNLIAGILYIFYSIKYIGLKANLLQLIKIGGFSIILIGLNYYLFQNSSSLWLCTLINLIITTILYILFNWFKISTLLQYIGNKMR